MKPTALLPLVASALFAATSLTATAQVTPMRTYSNSVGSDSWNWTKTRNDRVTIEGVPQPVLYNNIGTLESGLRPDNQNASTLLHKTSGWAHIDNGLQVNVPNGYYNETSFNNYFGTTPDGLGYTGVFGLYNGNLSAYGAAAFPNAMNILSGNYTQALVNNVLANPPAYDVVTTTESSWFKLTLANINPNTDILSLQLRVQAMGPTIANVANGTYLTTYDVVRQVVPLTLSYNGDASTLAMSSAELLSYRDHGGGNRHAFAPGNMEELWEFQWDLRNANGPITDLSITFANFPTSVISGIAVDQLQAIPEPSTYALLGAGLMLGFARWRRMRRA